MQRVNVLDSHQKHPCSSIVNPEKNSEKQIKCNNFNSGRHFVTVGAVGANSPIGLKIVA